MTLDDPEKVRNHTERSLQFMDIMKGNRVNDLLSELLVAKNKFRRFKSKLDTEHKASLLIKLELQGHYVPRNSSLILDKCIIWGFTKKDSVTHG